MKEKRFKLMRPNFWFTEEDVVDLFLRKNMRWFEPRQDLPRNVLEGKLEKAKEALLAYFAGEELDQNSLDYNAISYVVEKFRNEWMGGHGEPIFKDVTDE